MLTKFDGCVLLAMGLIQGFVIGYDLGWKRCMDEVRHLMGRK